jgi:beta-phosphoglucomutase-like phosphatase (HAD superfamily)
MKYKAIIFDMDGTIIDTAGIWMQANKVLIERRGIPYTPELQAELTPQIHGLATHKTVSIIKDTLKLKESLQDLITEKYVIAMNLYHAGVNFIEGFQEFHGEVVRLKLKNAVATNADNKTIKKANDALNLKNYFGDHIYGIESVNLVCKPDPAIYLHASGKLGVAPEECIAIEDSAFGIAAAQEAGIVCIGINTGKNFEQVKKADIIVDYYHEINFKKLLQ